MNINNLVFFDKNGDSYNFSLEDNYWKGTEYFLPLSLALFDNSNIFILERKEDGSYKFPVMEPNSRFEIKWTSQKFKDNLFLFKIKKEDINDLSHDFIERLSTITINHSDFNQEHNLDLSYPLQLNIAFNPDIEQAYQRTLQIYYITNSSKSLVLELDFYGEGEDEDERFRIWLENFGVKFNRTDALLLKDYDLSENLPDWSTINLARKNLLVNLDQIYPYVGTYKGLTNILKLLGYADVLRVREYWQDIDEDSLYYKKYATIDVTDLMYIGEFSKIDLVDLHGQIKKGGKYKKTEFLALAYQFTVASDTYDKDGLPLIESTTEFTPEEIFFKLHGLKRKLKNEILPINVIIKDVIGEFIYFSKFSLRNWPDTTYIESTNLNDQYNIKLLEPNTTALQLKIRDLKTLWPKINNNQSLFPEITFNKGQIEPYQNNQKYDITQLEYLIDAINNYYSEITTHDFYHYNEYDKLDYGIDTSLRIGCPIVLEADIKDLTLKDFNNTKFSDFITNDVTISTSTNIIALGESYFSCKTIKSFNIGQRIKINVTEEPDFYMIGTILEFEPQGYSSNTIKVDIDYINGYGTYSGWSIGLIDTYYTLSNIKYKNAYEIEWQITGPNSYKFNWRDSIANIYKIPHILPFTGTYDILLKVHDMHSSTSTTNYKIVVQDIYTTIESFIKIQDKYKYRFKDLHNVTIGDLGSSSLYMPYASVLNLNETNANFSSISQQYLSWFTYSANFGIGMPITGVIVKTKSKSNFGTGSSNGQPTLKDYSKAAIKDLKYVTFSEMGYVGDLLDGFTIDFNSNLVSMQFGGFNQIDFNISNAINFLQYIEQNTLPGWDNYRYQIVNDKIKATSKFQDKQNHSIIKLAYKIIGQFEDQSYTPNYLEYMLSELDIKLGEYILNLINPNGPNLYDNTNLKVGDIIRLINNDGGFIEGHIIELTNDNIIISANLINEVGDFNNGYDFLHIITKYTFTKPIGVYTNNIIDKINFRLSKVGLQLDTNLLFLTTSFSDSLIQTKYPYQKAKASDIRYWIDKKFITFKNDKQIGFLPSSFDQNSLSLDNVRTTFDTIIAPVNHPVFVTIANSPSIIKSIWSLFDINDNEIAKVEGSAYFIWRFDKAGSYKLKVEALDSRGNRSVAFSNITVARAMDIEEYEEYIESSLNLRKLQMTHN